MPQSAATVSPFRSWVLRAAGLRSAASKRSTRGGVEEWRSIATRDGSKLRASSSSVNLSGCTERASGNDQGRTKKMPKLQTRLAWFDRGAQAFARACPSVVRDVLPSHVGPLYVCPLCVTPTGFRAFMRQAVETNQLTVEHAPPEHAGGHAITLTCARCNHTAGSKLDSHASIAARHEDDPPGVLRDQRVRVALGGIQVNMTLEAGPA